VFAVPECFEITMHGMPSWDSSSAVVEPEGPAPTMSTDVLDSARCSVVDTYRSHFKNVSYLLAMAGRNLFQYHPLLSDLRIHISEVLG
jgi:hypothetical protein